MFAILVRCCRTLNTHLNPVLAGSYLEHSVRTPSARQGATDEAEETEDDNVEDD